MIDDSPAAHGRHLLIFACDLWLDAREIDMPDNFASAVESIKKEAANAKDETALRTLTDRFLALTGKLAAKDWKQYETRCSAADAVQLTAKPEPEPKRKPSKNSRSAAIRSF
jgi:hypothetical protein